MEGGFELKVEHRRAVAATLVFVGFCYAAFVESWTPWSWVVLSSCVHAGFFVCKPPQTMDLWTQRTTTWSLLSTLSFAHFLMQDETFAGWTSVYHFCSGPASLIPGEEVPDEPVLSALAYCTSTYRWNLNGWRKALSIWNFMLSSALGLQHLVIELGLGGLLPGEDAIPRECFVSIIWRLVPFFLNKWEADFGAECSSILFELPHFATELLVILPTVQLLAARLRVLARPPMNRGDPHVSPDIMLGRWISDRGRGKFWGRLRKNLRPLVMISGVTLVASLNAIQVPLYLEHTAISSAQSAEYMKYRGELAALHMVQGYNRLRRITPVHGEYLSRELIGIMSNTTLYACATSMDGMGCVSAAQEEMVMWMAKRGIILSLSGPLKDARGTHEVPALAINTTFLTAHPYWTLHALEFSDEGNRAGHMDYPDGVDQRNRDERGDRTKVGGAVERLQHVLFGKAFYGTEIDTSGSFISMQRQYMETVGRSAGGTKREGEVAGTDKTALETEQPWFARNPIVAFFSRPPPMDASRFLLLAEKHTVELERMASVEHRSIVPLIELALAIMRLSCEKWFSLVAMYVSYIIFRDPPPHAREYIKIVAVISRVFQHCILMSFPAVCWAYGAGFLFSTFASAVFWTNPIFRLVEHVKKVAMEVQPMHWHPVTMDEVERMGGNCAICWGSIGYHGAEGLVDQHDYDHDGNRDDISQGGGAALGGRDDNNDTAGDAVMGLSCGHAYHQSCLLEWLHSCFGQSRKATCPMCQSQVPLKITYKLRDMLSFGAGVEGGDDENPGRAQIGGAPGQRAYPGLATLVQALPNEFVGRWGFDLVVDGIDRVDQGGEERRGGDEPFAHDDVRDREDARANQMAWRHDDGDPGNYADVRRPEAGLGEAHSAHALIISEDLNASDDSASSIHLPEYQALSFGARSITLSFASEDDDEDYECVEEDLEDDELDDELEDELEDEELNFDEEPEDFIGDGELEDFDVDVDRLPEGLDEPYTRRLRPRRRF